MKCNNSHGAHRYTPPRLWEPRALPDAFISLPFADTLCGSSPPHFQAPARLLKNPFVYHFTETKGQSLCGSTYTHILSTSDPQYQTHETEGGGRDLWTFQRNQIETRKLPPQAPPTWSIELNNSMHRQYVIMLSGVCIHSCVYSTCVYTWRMEDNLCFYLVF